MSFARRQQQTIHLYIQHRNRGNKESDRGVDNRSSIICKRLSSPTSYQQGNNGGVFYIRYTAREYNIVYICQLSDTKERNQIHSDAHGTVQVVLDSAREILRRASISSTKSRWGVGFLYDQVYIVWQGSTSYCGDKKRCTSEILWVGVSNVLQDGKISATHRSRATIYNIYIDR